MDKKFIIVTILATVFIILGSLWAALKLGSQAQVEGSADAEASTTVTDYDWGQINIEGGKVEAFYEITNAGDASLKLYNVTTSCACTQAFLRLGDQISPAFGMHSKSAYILEVPPGETAQVQAIFDPLFHGPDAVGPITREITVETNDLDHKVLTFTASGQVIK